MSSSGFPGASAPTMLRSTSISVSMPASRRLSTTGRHPALPRRSRSAASVTSAAAPIQGRSKLELGEIGCDLDGPAEGRGGFCSHGLHQGLGGHVREHQPANPRCSRGATDVARRGVSLAMDLAAVLIQASRFVDQHVSPLDGLDEPGNRPRVAAVRESCAV
jgi:hypothetical protein